MSKTDKCTPSYFLSPIFHRIFLSSSFVCKKYSTIRRLSGVKLFVFFNCLIVGRNSSIGLLFSGKTYQHLLKKKYFFYRMFNDMSCSHTYPPYPMKLYSNIFKKLLCDHHQIEKYFLKIQHGWHLRCCWLTQNWCHVRHHQPSVLCSTTDLVYFVKQVRLLVAHTMCSPTVSVYPSIVPLSPYTPFSSTQTDRKSGISLLHLNPWSRKPYWSTNSTHENILCAI